MARPQRQVTLAIVLAAGQSVRIGDLAEGRPKGFLRVGGESLIERSVRLLFEAGISEVVLGTGFRRDCYEALARRFDGCRCVPNPRYASSGSLETLFCAGGDATRELLLLESDLLYERRALEILLADPRPDVLLTSGRTGSGDEVFVDRGEPGSEGRLVALSKDPTRLERPTCELVGLSKISPALISRVRAWSLAQGSDPAVCHYEEGLAAVAHEHPIHVVTVDDLAWTEIDDARHYRRAVDAIWPRIARLEEATEPTRKV